MFSARLAQVQLGAVVWAETGSVSRAIEMVPAIKLASGRSKLKKYLALILCTLIKTPARGKKISSTIFKSKFFLTVRSAGQYSPSRRWLIPWLYLLTRERSRNL